MQVDGGYRYPTAKISTALLLLGGLTVTALWVWAGLRLLAALGLLFSVEGTVLWASSFTPTGLMPPPRGFRRLIRWFFVQQRGIAFAINQSNVLPWRTSRSRRNRREQSRQVSDHGRPREEAGRVRFDESRTVVRGT